MDRGLIIVLSSLIFNKDKGFRNSSQFLKDLTDNSLVGLYSVYTVFKVSGGDHISKFCFPNNIN